MKERYQIGVILIPIFINLSGPQRIINQWFIEKIIMLTTIQIYLVTFKIALSDPIIREADGAGGQEMEVTILGAV